PAKRSDPMSASRILARNDSVFRSMLNARAETDGWQPGVASWTTPAARPNHVRGLSSKLSMARDELEIAGDASSTVRLVPRESTGGPGELREGLVVYQGARGPDVDVVVSSNGLGVESFFLIRCAEAPHTFTWDVTFSGRIAGAKSDARGLSF